VTVEAPDILASLSLEHKVETDQTAVIIYYAICQILNHSVQKLKDEQIREFLETVEPNYQIYSDNNSISSDNSSGTHVNDSVCNGSSGSDNRDSVSSASSRWN
jgi:hypothetical protein